jgi:hypothetical protein
VDGEVLPADGEPTNVDGDVPTDVDVDGEGVVLNAIVGEGEEDSDDPSACGY